MVSELLNPLYVKYYMFIEISLLVDFDARKSKVMSS